MQNDNETRNEDIDTYKHHMRLLEAILFASSEPLSVKSIHERIGVNIDLGRVIGELKDLYSERGVNLVEIDGHWAFRTAHDLADKMTLYKEVKKPLSRVALETLAIVAYHQPVTRAEIENIRGVSISKGTIDVLIEAGWVRPGSRRDVPGRPLTWVTTNAFLDHFGLSSLSDLPGLEELKSAGLLDSRNAIDNITERDLGLFDDQENENEGD